MSKTLIIYSTVDGQTKAICQTMADELSQAGEIVSMVSLAEVETDTLPTFDKILVGASIRYGKHRPELYRFVNNHHALLNAKKNAFFTVNVVARKPEKNTPETNPYMQKFLQLSLWQPQLQGVFAGNIAYPNYGLFDRSMIRLIMWITKGPTDTSGTYEFTDWQRVKTFAAEFAEL
ncbi:menaquinone-dependent protoporphyrinogen IX dehydrogenase [Shewanella indica]|uniref:menaquinone-dependent protoporphyrinogen IX dehydrogenase n=1 Tax=Shewanella indica TaxID=768528 RepID=UPI000C336E39|nr:menaquinone-dependent protoporphyrinogen IX dehydrogenase [Shewanella indica]GHB12896.1 protoporphyrinogen oxidase [Shewanella indica]